ncbi:MAG: zinc-ribbon domain-containing protein [Gaiellaceae bacterium]
MICSSCGTENRPDRKFCSKCGTALANLCPACGAQNESDDAFCGECGAALAVQPREVPAPAPPPSAEGVSSPSSS